MLLTRTLPHIHLCAINYAKVAALDAIAAEYMALCQQYVTLFCTETEPDGYAAPCFPVPSPNAGNGSPSSKRQASPNPGGPITNAHRRTSTTPSPPGWKRRMRRKRLHPDGLSGTRPR